MKTIGSFTVTIRVRLNQDITLEEAREFVNEMDYNITDSTGKVSIAETEVIEDSIEDEGVIGMDDCPPDNFE